MERKDHIIAIDLGSSAVAVAVGVRTPESLLDVVCVVSKPVEGVHAGKIENIELVSRAIGNAVAEAEELCAIRITEAYAGISGDFVRCARHTDHVFVSDSQNGVSQEDVEALFERMRHVQAPDDEAIMERIPQNYAVDENMEVQNPVGSFGKKLSSTFNFILCLKTPMQRLDMALKRLGIKMLGVIPGALAAAEAVLAPDEKEEGVAVVDIGGGVTDVAVYSRNVVRYVASIPMGASAINRDIRTMSVLEKYVESLKQKYGSAVAELAAEDKLIRVNGRTPREAKDILLRNLATVIEARATDIVEFVMQEIKDSGFAEKLPYGIVLTGGSAKLKDLDELVRRMTGYDVRVALPEACLTEEAKERVADPAYATVVGILIKGARCEGYELALRPAGGGGVTGRVAPEQPAGSPHRGAEAHRAETGRQPVGHTPYRGGMPAEHHRPGAVAQGGVPPQPRAETTQGFVPPRPRSEAAQGFVPPRRSEETPHGGISPRRGAEPAQEYAQPRQRSDAEQGYAPHHYGVGAQGFAPQPVDPREEGADNYAGEEQPVPRREAVSQRVEAEPREKRGWGSILQKAIDKINGSFTHAEDEEI